MLCHEGKVSLAGFVGAILTTVITAIAVMLALPADSSSWYSVTCYIGGPIVIYVICNIVVYFVANDGDSAVSVSSEIIPNRSLFRFLCP